MSSPRFSLRMLLAAVAYVALVLTVAATGSLVWANVVFNVTIGGLMIATIVAVFSLYSPTFWRGFCLIGWIFLFLTLALHADNVPPNIDNIHAEDRLLTHEILPFAYERGLAPMYANRGEIFP